MTSNNGKHIYKFPYDIDDVDDETFEKASACLHETVDKNSVLVGPKKYFLTGIYKKCYSEIYNFQARPDDILLLGFPRTGTTLHCEMLWQIENNLDFKTSESNILIHRFPVIDLCLSMGDMSMLNMLADNAKITDDVKNIANKYSTLTIDNLSNNKERRFIRSHLPISLLSPSFFKSGCKVVYCARNPKDLVVSYYHVTQFFRPTQSEMISFSSFWESFKNNWTLYSPYIEHVKEGWKRRNDNNFLFLFYEDTIKDLGEAVRKMATFLGKELSAEQVENLVDYLSIDKFKKNTSVNCQHLCDLGIASSNNKFIRNGKSGGWRKYFVGNLEKEANKWIMENLKDTDLCFPED